MILLILRLRAITSKRQLSVKVHLLLLRTSIICVNLCLLACGQILFAFFSSLKLVLHLRRLAGQHEVIYGNALLVFDLRMLFLRDRLDVLNFE